jgi:glycosyltransferase involved in cell wall biosynthesis
MSTKSILHVVAPASIGGLERVVQMLASSQRSAGYEVRVLAVLAGVPADVGIRFLQPLADAGIPVHEARVPGRAYLRERGVVAEICRLHRPDVVHTHGYRPDVVDAGVARSLGCATVSAVHGFTGGGPRNRCYELLQLRALRRFDAVVAVSRPLAHRLRGFGVPADRVHVVPNAWRGSEPLDRDAARREMGLPDDAFVAGWVGRLSHEKGPDLLLEALALLEDMPLRAAVLGDGPLRSALEHQARRSGLEARMHWRGAVPGAERLFRAFDVFVMSSRTEGTPIALFEAMAAGVPIVATEVGGVPDVVSPREAELVPPENPAALATALRAIPRDPAAAAAKARAARERLCREFQTEPWIERYDAVYRAALERARGRR